MSEHATLVKRLLTHHWIEPDINGPLLAERYVDPDCAEAAARIAELEAERDRLAEHLGELAQTEADYRLKHDTLGDGHIDAGRAWDKMRKSGDRARAALSDPSGE